MQAAAQERAAAPNELDLKAKILQEAEARFEREGGASYGERAEIEAERQATSGDLPASAGLAEGICWICLGNTWLTMRFCQVFVRSTHRVRMEMGYYPRELDTRIAAGYREIAQIIAESRKTE